MFGKRGCVHRTLYKTLQPLFRLQHVNLLHVLQTTKNASTAGNLEYCVNLVKKHDVENYLIGAFHIPRKYRASFFAIHSFNIEIALIRFQGKVHVVYALHEILMYIFIKCEGIRQLLDCDINGGWTHFRTFTRMY